LEHGMDHCIQAPPTYIRAGCAGWLRSDQAMRQITSEQHRLTAPLSNTWRGHSAYEPASGETRHWWTWHTTPMLVERRPRKPRVMLHYYSLVARLRKAWELSGVETYKYCTKLRQSLLRRFR